VFLVWNGLPQLVTSMVELLIYQLSEESKSCVFHKRRQIHGNFYTDTHDPQLL